MTSMGHCKNIIIWFWWLVADVESPCWPKSCLDQIILSLRYQFRRLFMGTSAVSSQFLDIFVRHCRSYSKQDVKVWMHDNQNTRNLHSHLFEYLSTRTRLQLHNMSIYRSGTVNSKSFVGKVLLRIKWKFELINAL